MSYKLDEKLENIVNKYCKEIPYEGMEIDKGSIKDSVSELIISLMRGYGTYVLTNYELTEKGWRNKEQDIIYPRIDVIEDFLHENL